MADDVIRTASPTDSQSFMIGNQQEYDGRNLSNSRRLNERINYEMYPEGWGSGLEIMKKVVSKETRDRHEFYHHYCLYMLVLTSEACLQGLLCSCRI